MKFHVAEAGADGTWKAVADRAELTRLGEGLKEGGSITKEAAERTAAAIKGMVDEAHKAGAIATAAAGTAGLRIATNAADVREIIRARTGCRWKSSRAMKRRASPTWRCAPACRSARAA